MLVLSSMLCVLVSASLAATLYQWKDAAGHMHFTDNLSKVPAEHRSNSARDMRPLVAASKVERVLDGRALYEAKCATCHVIGYKNDGAREGLAWAIISDKTKYPQPPDKLFLIIREAVDGEVDMPVMKISDKEVMAIANYLIKELNP